MKQYHKIQTVFKRDPKNKFKTLLQDQFAIPEFEYLAKNEWVFTEKVDGTNIRIMFNGEQIKFGGKSDRAQMPPFLLDKLHFIFDPQLETFKEEFPDGVCLYGEGYGAKIQKGGGNYREDQDFVLFDVKIGNWWLRRSDVIKISLELNIFVVPDIGVGTISEMVKMTQKGFNSIWGNFQAEGIVARPAIELKTRNGQRIITKIKCKDFY